jgi:DNA mismatch repair ATPase MutS
MSLDQYYTEQIQKYQQAVYDTQKLETRLSFMRLGAFMGALLLFYFALGTSLGFAVFLLLAGLAVFVNILKKHLATSRKKTHLQNLLIINQKELDCIHGNFQSYPDGKEFMDKEHPYSGDLDIFGKASLFQFINRTTSKPGSITLAKWLQHPAEISEIFRRQEAITELKDLADWRQELMAIGYKYEDSGNNPEVIMNWAKESPNTLKSKVLKPVINICSILAITAVIGWPFGVPEILLTLLIGINVSIVYKFLNDVKNIHNSVSQTSTLLKSYEATILLIENQNFKSAKLLELQKKFISTNISASKQLKELYRLVNKLDYRLNILISIPLNLFYFWDIRQVLKLEKWKDQNRGYIQQWFDAMAEFEALSSLANLYYNNPDWKIPLISYDHFKFNTENLGHPLIPANRRVSNDFDINSTGKIIIVTGSNMSGKSTFLRTCGTNIVLAMAGAPVCAKTFEISRVMVLTSMRIIDSLEENTSSFYAELKRLANIIKTVEEKDKVFLLLDEILRGTNSNDRHIGSVALIKQLVKNDAVGIIATHDLALSQLEVELPHHIDNYNFDVKIENEELFFDYKLMKGICKSLNASILMKKMGIKVQ